MQAKDIIHGKAGKPPLSDKEIDLMDSIRLGGLTTGFPQIRAVLAHWFEFTCGVYQE